MGAWGIDFFENDDAMDLIISVSKLGLFIGVSLAFLEINRNMKENRPFYKEDIMDAGSCEYALAASALIAFRLGLEVPAEVTEDIHQVLNRSRFIPPRWMIDKCIKYLSMALSDKGEITSPGLWPGGDENEDLHQWKRNATRVLDFLLEYKKSRKRGCLWF
ncbi:DUF4259 domain-containing protein [bacterium]|nr:DUF4259 domain-containing protein [bacterium]